MYGSRGRIGLIVPSTNTVMESEFWAMAPKDISVHTARTQITKTTPEGLEDMARYVRRAANELKSCLCDVLLYGCTSGSFIKGTAWEAEFRVGLEREFGLPVLTTSYACLLALKALGKRKISIATPYIESINQMERTFFTQSGYDIVDIQGLGMDSPTDIGKNEPEVSYRLARQVVKADTELLFISCTDFRSLENIPSLEAELKIPVISSNQASMWAALRAMGVMDCLEQCGSLFVK